MADSGSIRLSKAAKELNVGISTVYDFLESKGIDFEHRPNTKIEDDTFQLLVQAFAPDREKKKESDALAQTKVVRETITIDDNKRKKEETKNEQDEVLIKNVGGYDPNESRPASAPPPPVEEKRTGPTVVGKIDLSSVKSNRPKKRADEEREKREKEAQEKAVKAKQEAEAAAVVAAKAQAEAEALAKDLADKKAAEAAAEAAAKAEEPKPVVSAEKTPAVEPEKTVEIAAEKTADRTEEKAAEPKTEETAKTEEAPKTAETAKEVEPEKAASSDPDFLETKVQKLTGPTVVGKIDLPDRVSPADKKKAQEEEKAKRKRKRIAKVTPSKPFTPGGGGGRPFTPGRGGSGPQRGGRRGPGGKAAPKVELTPEQIQNQVRETLAALKNKGKSSRSKYRRDRRDAVSERKQKEIEQQEADEMVLKVTEFVTASELASMMNVQVTEIISMCMSLGMMISINQRLDSETLTLLAEEFGFSIEFVGADIEESIQEVEDAEEDLIERSPIVTVMGHVDHGKTSLLDHIRRANVIAGEAGGITQHIGAYSVELEGGRQITFLDTPGHEAFTAMRARGAQVTDIAIIVIAADDAVMPQTIEAINHAQAAGVPMVFAFNKIDRPGANSEKIKEQLANMNILVEDWGGKFQSQEISAKSGLNINELLEKVLLEADLLEVKANPNRLAKGAVIEASLDKGRGYVATMLVQTGTMRVGDIMLAGSNSGRVKAMFNERGVPVEEAGPSTPVSLLGLNGAPNAGDTFMIMEDEREVKNIATKRQQLQREQSLRTQKRRTLEDIGEILKLGDFHEQNLIIKGDVDGSVEALADSLLKLSTENVVLNVIHKSVGQISESDVLLATASDAVIIGFQVRPSAQARKRAENEGIEIRLYSIIYDAINDMRAAMEGMLKPKIEERIVCNIEVRETFRISKVGTVAGCFVLDGTVTRNTKIRLIRDGVVMYTGELGSLKRFKEDVKEVKANYECGLNIDKYNDIKEGDIIEGFEEVEVARTLE